MQQNGERAILLLYSLEKMSWFSRIEIYCYTDTVRYSLTISGGFVLSWFGFIRMLFVFLFFFFFFFFFLFFCMFTCSVSLLFSLF